MIQLRNRLQCLINIATKDGKETFQFLLPMIDPTTLYLNALSITLCSNLSFCLLPLIYLCLSAYKIFHVYFVPTLYNSLLVIIKCDLSVFSVDESCFSLISLPICHFSDYSFFEHVRSPTLTISCSFNHLCHVKHVLAINCILINHETDKNANSI